MSPRERVLDAGDGTYGQMPCKDGTGGGAVLLGLALSLVMLFDWALADFQLDALSLYGIAGLTLMTLSFRTMFFTFIYEVFRLSETGAESST